MKIQTITISVSRKVPHPAIDFANLSSHASATATLEDGEQAGIEAENLQKLLEAIVDTHIDDLLDRHTPQRKASKAQSATQGTATALAAKHSAKVVQ